MNKLFRTLLLTLAFGASASSVSALGINKSFTPAVREPQQISRARIEIVNDLTVPATQAALEDIFPAGVFVATPANIVSNCDGTVSASNDASSGRVNLSGGTVPARVGTIVGKCFVEVNVYAVSKGTYINSIPANELSAMQGGNPVSNDQLAQATLVADLQSLTGSLGFGLGGVYLQGGEVSTRTLTLNNPNSVDLTGVALTHNLAAQAGYNVHAFGPVVSTCGGSTTITDIPSGNANFGTTSNIAVAGATIPAGGSCTITWNVEPSRAVTLPYNDTQLNHTIPAGAITTNEGAKNTAAISSSIRTVTGIRVNKYFNNASTATLNTNTATSATLKIVIENFNALSINPFNIADVLPAGLTASNVFRNTCGGTASAGTSVAVNGASLGAAGSPLPGLQVGTCEIEARVVPNTTSNATYVNTIPSGAVGGYQFPATTAKLNVTDVIAPEDPLRVSKAFQYADIYPGDTQTLTFTIRNIYDQNIRNISLTDNLVANMTANSQIRIGAGGVVGKTCGGTATAIPDSSLITISGVDLAAGQACTVTVSVTMASTSPSGNRVIYNTVPASQISFDLLAAAGRHPVAGASASLVVRTPFGLSKSYSPTTVVAGGVTRMRLQVSRISRVGSSTSNIHIVDNLPAGHTISATPNILNECGGAVATTSTSITLTNGFMAGPAVGSVTPVSCSLYVDVVAPLGNGSAVNTANAATAKDNGQPNGLNALTSGTASATLTRAVSSIIINKEFLTLTVKSGQPSRVRITLANTAAGSIQLTGVGLVDSFAGKPLQLAATPQPTFTNASGVPNAGGCTGGAFSMVTGAGGSITLSGADIAPNTTCYFEFNATSIVGGNVQNNIPVGAVRSDQGATNSSAVVATLTVERELNVTKGFNPPVLEPGAKSAMTISIINRTDSLYTGSPVALIDTLPVGMTVDPASIATTCQGAGVQLIGQNFSLHGGIFPPGFTCTMTALVSAAPGALRTNTIPANALVTVEGATNPGPTVATLVEVAPPTIAKSFSPATIPFGGVSKITFTLSNPNTAALLPAGLTGASFSDTLADMVIASPPNIGGTCANATISTSAGGTGFVATGIRLLPAASCTITVDVTSNVTGTHPNQTSGVSTVQTPTVGAPSNIANLTVGSVTPLSLTKKFVEDEVLPNAPARMILTIANANGFPVTLDSPGLADNFPTGMVLASSPNLVSSCGIGVDDGAGGAVAAGNTTIRLLGGTIPPAATCTVAISVSGTAGSYTNVTSALTSSIGSTPAASDSIVVLNTPTIESGQEPVRNVHESDNAFYVNSILGPLDRIGGVPAVMGPGGNVTATNVTFSSPPGQPNLSLTADGTIIVGAGSTPGTYTVTYTICQNGQPANCAPPRTETVVITTSVIVATQDHNPLVVRQADYDQEPANVLGVNDTLDGAQATVGPGTGGNVDLSILSVTGPGGATSALSVNINTGIITVKSGTPPGDYTIAYRICEDDNADNCATANEVVRVRITPIVAATEANRAVAGSDTPTGAGNILGSGDRLDGSQATVGPASAGNVDLRIDSVLNGAVDASSLIAVDVDTGEIVVAGGTPDGTYVISYTICEEANRGNCASATETVVVTSRPIAAGPEPTRVVAGSDGAVAAGSVLNSANDTLNGAPATLGGSGNVLVSVVPGVNTAAELSLNPVTGVITVAPGTPPGTYTIEYRICEKVNTDNCATAIETVQVVDTPIVAAPEANRPVFAADAAQPAGPVLGSGDQVNGVAAVAGYGVNPGGNVVVSQLPGGSPELTLSSSTGIITVAAGTGPGTYTINYRICEPANRDNCADATETVVVSVRSIAAGPEASRPTVQADLPQSAGNVLAAANDTLGSDPATVGGSGNVVLSVVSADTPLTLNLATGDITVAANTAPGSYTIEYKICEAAYQSNCATATETVTVSVNPIVAAPEADRPVTGSNIDRTAGSVIGTGDQLDGVQATLGSGGNVVVSVVTGANTDSELTLDTTTGIITVAGGTAAGTYTIEYRICEAANLANCATAIETVVVSDNSIAAGPEADRPITGSDLAQSAGNVLDPSNDTLLGSPAVPGPGGNVVLTVDSISPELSLNTNTGELTVAAGTPPGSYTVTYRLCETANVINCAIATETVVVTDTPIQAAAEPDRPLAALDASQPAGNVLDPSNDTLNGVAAVPGPGGNVVLTTVTGSPELTLDPATGEITVAADTGPGTYTVTYQICEVGNSDNCATATETVVIANTPILAGAEPDRPLRSVDASQSAGNVLDPSNDTLNGVAAVPGPGGNVVLTTVSGSPELTLDPATGEITVVADTGPGTYTITYQICEAVNLDNCATATETVVITTTPIAANGITFPVFDTAAGGTTPPVTDDDLLDGVAPIPGAGGTVVLTVVTPATDPGIVLDPETGIISVAVGTPPGSYPVTYRICEVGNLDNCATATETVVVTAITANPEPYPPFTTDGGTTTTVLGSDLIGGGPATLATVTIRVITEDDGVTLDPLTGLITLAPGKPAGSYQVRYEICSVALPNACDQTTETVVQMPIGRLKTVKTLAVTDNGDGVNGVGDVVTFTITVQNQSNVALSGVHLTDRLTAGDGTVLTLDSGPTFVSADAASPEGDLLIGETATYTASYTLTIDAVTRRGIANTATGIGTTVIPPGAAGTPTVVEDISDNGDDTDGNTTDDPTVLVLDPTVAPTGLTLTKTTPRGVVERGGAVPYTITLKNDNATVAGPLSIADDLPTQFVYMPGSALLNGTAITPTVTGRHVQVDGILVPPLSSVTLSLTARVLTGAQAGEHVNFAFARDPVTGALLAPKASATVRIIPEPVFDCGDVIGKVFDDRNRDGYQNPPGPRPITNDDVYTGKLDPGKPAEKTGEPGIPGVRLAGVDGTIVTTDAHGRFHVPCAMLPADRGSNFILKVDTRSLPAGYRLTTENPRVVRLTRGKMTEMNFGAALTRVVRVDLNRSAFVTGKDGRTGLSAGLVAGIAKLLPQIADEAVNLRLSYYIRPGGGSDGDQAEARRRLKLVESHIRKEWPKVGRVKLTIETSIQRQSK